MPWIEPTENDDWGYKTVHLGKPHYTSTYNLIKNHPSGPVVQTGEYKIRWPNGHEEVSKVEMVPYVERVSDMGREYNAYGKIPYLIVSHYGALLKVPLTKAGIEVWRE